MSEKRNKSSEKDPKRLVGPNGEFVSSFKVTPELSEYNIGYIEELCEWVYYHDNLNNAEKLERITGLESIIRMYLNGEDENGKIKEGFNPPYGVPIQYTPTWSTKLIEDEKKKQE